MKRAAAGVFISIALFAQRPAFDAFDVATIHPTAPDWRGGRFVRMETAHQLVARNHTLKTLLAAAFNLSPKAIFGGPGWLDSDKFDIVAKAPGDVRPNFNEQMAMLRALLVERFGVTFHRELRELSCYTLTVGKGGVKFKESTASFEDSPTGAPPLIFVVFPNRVRLPAKYATMGDFVTVMQRTVVGRPVVDQTGLAGRYDFDLEFLPDDSQFDGGLHLTAGSDEPAKPGLFAALQEQLGLRLTAAKAPVDVLILDRAERPSAN